jgi:DNA helicase-2/ATP-dependent DNA helicase PcrA
MVKIEELEEERRLFYVGMTRAKNYLTLITYKSIGEKQLEQSRFLDELQEIN